MDQCYANQRQLVTSENVHTHAISGKGWQISIHLINLIVRDTGSGVTAAWRNDCDSIREEELVPKTIAHRSYPTHIYAGGHLVDQRTTDLNVDRTGLRRKYLGFFVTIRICRPLILVP